MNSKKFWHSTMVVATLVASNTLVRALHAHTKCPTDNPFARHSIELCPHIHSVESENSRFGVDEKQYLEGVGKVQRYGYTFTKMSAKQVNSQTTELYIDSRIEKREAEAILSAFNRVKTDLRSNHPVRVNVRECIEYYTGVSYRNDRMALRTKLNQVFSKNARVRFYVARNELGIKSPAVRTIDTSGNTVAFVLNDLHFPVGKFKQGVHQKILMGMFVLGAYQSDRSYFNNELFGCVARDGRSKRSATYRPGDDLGAGIRGPHFPEFDYSGTYYDLNR